MPDFTVFDASIWYTLAAPRLADGALRLQLAVKNLTDEMYFPGSGADLRRNIGAPRSVVGSASLTF